MKNASTSETPLARFLAAWDRFSDGGRAAWYLAPGFLLEAALATWLAFAFAVFLGHEGSAAPLFATGVGLGTGLVGRLRGDRGARALQLAGLLATVAAFAWLAGRLAGVTVSVPAALWLGVWTTVLSGLGYLLLRPVAITARFGEIARWILLLAAAVWLVRPFYSYRPIGAGDAHWYALMLADFAAQVRAGEFPVWVGQTEYAFNGAIYPLRLAPWFQHFGALLDQLTLHRLDFLALRNGTIAVNMAVVCATAYGLLRWRLPERPGHACLLALALAASPATLAPLYSGDQYMTFLALPFLCLATCGLVRTFEQDGWPGHLPLAAGVAGLWITHAPTALWTSFLFATAYTARGGWRLDGGQLLRAAASAALWAILGGYAVVSALGIENAYPFSAEKLGELTTKEVLRLFPGIVLPLSPQLDRTSDYQPGYALFAVLGVILATRPWRLPRPLAVAAALPLGLLFLLLLPLPGWAGLVWQHMPDLVLVTTNTWPQQRLVPVAAVLLVFVFTLTRGVDERWWRPRPGTAVLIVGLLLAWSGWQADRLVRKAQRTVPAGPRPGLLFQPNNLTLTRYPFATFAFAPAYFSHGYLDPVLEHRLLRHDGTPLLTNLDGAVDRRHATLLASGALRAINEGGTAYYNLSPALTLPADTPLALRLDIAIRNQPGWFQVIGEDVRREYMLPDSGDGLVRHAPSRAFGTLPTSSKVIPLLTRHAGGESPRLTVILPELPNRKSLDYARYELWRYAPAALPVAVQSWVPYRLVVQSPESAWLETPRLWFGGYQAEVNGQRVAVERSADNLAMFAVPAGRSEVVVRYSPPGLVAVTYWLCLLGWLTLAGAGLVWLIRTTRPPPLTAGV